MKIYSLILLTVVFFVGCADNTPAQAIPKFSPYSVEDKDTGLMWKIDDKKPLSANSYSSALHYCNNTVLGKYNDWRVPSIQELISIIDYTQNSKINRSRNMIKKELLMITNSGWTTLISSTLSKKGYYQGLELHNAVTHNYDPNRKQNRILCVRGKKKAIY